MNSSAVSSTSWPSTHTRCAPRSTRSIPNCVVSPLLVRRRAAQDRLHAEEELADAEWLDDVVVGAELESDDAIDLLALRRQHHDADAARRRVLAERLAKLRARIRREA